MDECSTKGKGKGQWKRRARQQGKCLELLDEEMKGGTDYKLRKRWREASDPSEDYKLLAITEKKGRMEVTDGKAMLLRWRKPAGIGPKVIN